MKGSGRQASREPDHKHPAWETNEKNWETSEKKWETNERKPGRQMKSTGRQMKEVGDKPAGNPTRPSSTKATIL